MSANVLRREFHLIPVIKLQADFPSLRFAKLLNFVLTQLHPILADTMYCIATFICVPTKLQSRVIFVPRLGHVLRIDSFKVVRNAVVQRGGTKVSDKVQNHIHPCPASL